MPVFLVANPKGGVGKSTVATNLAGWFARQGRRTMLGDLDKQQSSRAWLDLRPQALPRIETWDIDEDRVARPPQGVTHAVVDTPAALHGHLLKTVLKAADRIIVPLQPSLFDIYATQGFLAKLADKGVLKDDGRVGVLGMRVDARTRSAEQLQRFVEALGRPRRDAVGRGARPGREGPRAVAAAARVGRRLIRRLGEDELPTLTGDRGRATRGRATRRSPDDARRGGLARDWNRPIAVGRALLIG